MKQKIFFALLLCITYLSSNAFDDRNIVGSQLKTVTVYRSGAEMLHTASALLKQGNNELIIDNLSNQLDINSIQINAPSTVTILGIEFSNNYLISVDKSPRMQMLEDSIEQVQKEINKIDLSVTNTNDLLEVLKANRDIKGAQTGLSVAELMKLMDYYKSKSLELQNDIFLQNEKKRKEQELIDKLKNQLTEEQTKNTFSAGRLVLQLSAATAGKADFTVSYIAQNAYWTPFYDIRVENIKSPLKVVYKAKVVQTTGIDWKQVKLSLSTSMPGQWGAAPVLQSWFLGYINPVAVMNKNLSYNTIQPIAASSNLSEVVVRGYANIRGDSNDESDKADSKPIYVVNGAIMSENEFQKIAPSAIKKIDKLKSSQATAIYGAQAMGGAVVIELKDGLEDYVSVADNTLNVTFDIDTPYDVPTNGKEQNATIQSFDINANYKHYSVPKLDNDAYLLAEVPDWEKLNLLPGDANIIFEGTYVGKSFIDPNSTSDTLNLTLGKDKRVIVKREKLIDFSSIKFLGSNKLQKFTYEITVKNNKNETVNMLLKDQFPLSTNNDITVELLESGDAEINNEIGVLNWKLQLAPGESKKVRFAYSVKYPKDKTLNL